jgi:hypothetical protein
VPLAAKRKTLAASMARPLGEMASLLLVVKNSFRLQGDPTFAARGQEFRNRARAFFRVRIRFWRKMTA